MCHRLNRGEQFRTYDCMGGFSVQNLINAVRRRALRLSPCLTPFLKENGSDSLLLRLTTTLNLWYGRGCHVIACWIKDWLHYQEFRHIHHSLCMHFSQSFVKRMCGPSVVFYMGEHNVPVLRLMAQSLEKYSVQFIKKWEAK